MCAVVRLEDYFRVEDYFAIKFNGSSTAKEVSMKRKWHNPPQWDQHLDEAIEEINAMGLGDEGLIACPAEPPRHRGYWNGWPGVVVVAVWTFGVIGICVRILIAVAE